MDGNRLFSKLPTYWKEMALLQLESFGNNSNCLQVANFSTRWMRTSLKDPAQTVKSAAYLRRLHVLGEEYTNSSPEDNTRTTVESAVPSHSDVAIGH